MPRPGRSILPVFERWDPGEILVSCMTPTCHGRSCRGPGGALSSWSGDRR